MTTHKSDSIEDRRQKPWAMVEIELLREPRITPQCKALYGLLITYGPQSIFPGQDTLAKCLGTSRQTVKRWLDDLKLQGLIDWDNRTGTSNKYYILGYANFKGDVTPTLQGCNTSITGDVTPTLHDLDPLILNQELERPPLADSPPVEDTCRNCLSPWPCDCEDPAFLCGTCGCDRFACHCDGGIVEDSLHVPLSRLPPQDPTFWAEGETPPEPSPHEPVEQGKARRCRELGTDPLGVASVVVQNRAGVAHPDGGDPSRDGDPWRDRPVREWCVFIGLKYERQSKGLKRMLGDDLRRIATTGVMRKTAKTPDETGEAIRKMTKSDSCKWLRSAGRPTHKEFTNVLINVLCGQELPAGKANGASGGRAPREQVISSDMVVM